VLRLELGRLFREHGRQLRRAGNVEDMRRRCHRRVQRRRRAIEGQGNVPVVPEGARQRHGRSARVERPNTDRGDIDRDDVDGCQQRGKSRDERRGGRDGLSLLTMCVFRRAKHVLHERDADGRTPNAQCADHYEFELEVLAVNKTKGVKRSNDRLSSKFERYVRACFVAS